MPVPVGLESMGCERLKTEATISKDNNNEKVTIFRASSPAPAAATNGEKCSNDSAQDNIVVDVHVVSENGDHVDEIPLASCDLDIANVLEKRKMASSLADVSITHRNVTQFLETVMTSPTTTMRFIISTLISCPHYMDIFLCNNLFLDKVFSAFRNDVADTRDQKTSLEPAVIRNIMCLLIKIEDYVLKEMDLDVLSTDGQHDRWDNTEPAFNFISYFTKEEFGSTTSMWFISNLEISNVAEFFLLFIEDFHSKADFTVDVNRWIIEGGIAIKLIEALGDLSQSSSHDNITSVVLGLLDLARKSACNRKKGPKAVTALAEHLYCSVTLTCLVATIQSLLQHQTLTLTTDQIGMRTNGVKCCFQILSRLLQFDQNAAKGCGSSSSSSCSVGPNQKSGSKKKVFMNPRDNINSLIVDYDFMTLLCTTLEVGGPKTFLRLTSYGTAPFGILRRSILGFIHDLILHTDATGLLMLLEYNKIFEYLFKYLFWLHPLNSFIHLKICSIVQALLNSGVAEAASAVILQNNFIEACLEFLKKTKPPGQQKSYIMKMLGTLITVSACSVTNALEKWGKANPQLKGDWDSLVLTELPNYLQKQKLLLGGVPKPIKEKDSKKK